MLSSELYPEFPDVHTNQKTTTQHDVNMLT